jgi:hypothetical protein
MPRLRSLTSILFETARTVDDAETRASGNRWRIERRVKTKVLDLTLRGTWPIPRRPTGQVPFQRVRL